MRLGAVSILFLGCSAGADPVPEEPAPPVIPSATVAQEVVPVAPSVAPAAPSTSAPALASAPPPPPATPKEPVLVDENGDLIPQTEDEPSTEDPLFRHHVELLWKAIEADDPELARSFFFPKVAYESVKAIAKPGRDWERRLWRLFTRDVHAYHEKIGEGATFVGYDVPSPGVQWMKRGREGNAIGYYRVKRSQLRYRKGDGEEQKLEVTSMMSWRGQWYVVHLHGFK
ncbi:MAG: hypothetical protein AAGA56_16565 [Myxococcota bacterium]